jgi:hypothetical protein
MNDDILENIVRIIDMYDDIYQFNDLITYKSCDSIEQLTIIED